MKRLSYLLQILGLLCLTFFVVNMFTFWIMNTMLWITIMFVGIMLTMGGFWVYEVIMYNLFRTSPLLIDVDPVLVVEIERRYRVKISSCRNCVYLCAILVIMSVSTFI